MKKQIATRALHGIGACIALVLTGCSPEAEHQEGDLEAQTGWKIEGGSSTELLTLTGGPNAMIAVKGVGRFDVDTPAIATDGEVEAVTMRVRVPVASSGSRWDGELLVSAPDASSPTGFRYIGGKSLTPLSNGEFSDVPSCWSLAHRRLKSMHLFEEQSLLLPLQLGYRPLTPPDIKERSLGRGFLRRQTTPSPTSLTGTGTTYCGATKFLPMLRPPPGFELDGFMKTASHSLVSRMVRRSP